MKPPFEAHYRKYIFWILGGVYEALTMRSHGCQFQSLREQFDTTTAAGEMVLFTIANIAQFERKQCSERITANFKARAERGLFNGGSVPIGYTRIPEKKGYLVIKEDEALIVREAYSTFLMEGTLSKTGKALNERGFRLPQKRECGGDKPRRGYFMVDNLYEMLINKAYIGQRVYQVGGEERTSRAVWEPIIPEKMFHRVQEILKSNYRRTKSHSDRRYPFLLSGLCVCGQCADRLPGKSAHGNGGKIPYYEHGWATKRQAYLNKKIFKCEPPRIQAKKLEPLVWEEITKLLTDPDFSKSLIDEAQKIHEETNHVPEADKLRNKICGIEEQIEALAEHLSKIPKGVSPTPVFNQMQKLESVKQESQRDLEAMARLGYTKDEPAPFKDYQAYLTAVRNLLSFADAPDLRAKITQRLVQKVEILPTSFRIHFYVGKSSFVPIEPDPANPPTIPQGVATPISFPASFTHIRGLKPKSSPNG
jgi:site-specific DNA recombinase